MQALTVDDIQRIHHATLNVLANPGVTFHTSPEAVAILESNGCRSDGFRVCFPEELVAECLARLPHRDDLTFSLAPLAFSTDISPKQGESHVGLIGNAYYIYDYEKRARRDCVESDLDDKYLILDSLRNFECDCCNLVFHSERHGGRVWASYESASASAAFIRRRVTDRSRVAQLTQRDLGTLPVRLITRSDEERKLEVLGQMVLQGAEPTLALLNRLYVPFAWCNPISPLQYFPDETNAILRVAESQHPSRVIMISPDIMMGATGPVTLAGTLVQHNAEVLAGVVLAQLVGPGTPVIYGCVSTAMDLRVAEISMGHFETNMLNAAAVQKTTRTIRPPLPSPERRIRPDCETLTPYRRIIRVISAICGLLTPVVSFACPELVERVEPPALRSNSGPSPSKQRHTAQLTTRGRCRVGAAHNERQSLWTANQPHTLSDTHRPGHDTSPCCPTV